MQQNTCNQDVGSIEDTNTFVLTEEQMAEFELNLEMLKVESNQQLNALTSQPKIWS